MVPFRMNVLTELNYVIEVVKLESENEGSWVEWTIAWFLDVH